MNETVRTLLRKSGLPQQPIQNDIFLEKFAHLIAQECSIIVARAGTDSNEKRHISEILNEHFGVK